VATQLGGPRACSPGVMRLLLALILLLLAPAAAQAAAPAAGTLAATDIGPTTATLNATVNPNGLATTVHFEYGTTEAYGQRTPDEDAGSGGAETGAQEAITGLTPGTTYHFRVVATNADGTTTGSDASFKTAAAPRVPAVTSSGAGEIGPRAVLLRTTIDPNGAETRYRFEYGSSAQFGSHTPDRVLATGDTPVALTEPLDRLRPYKRYYFRLVATNAAGTTNSRTRTFTTAREPTAITLSVAGASTPWGDGIQVFGRVSGAGRAGIPVGLERQAFPYTDPFTTAGTPPAVKADRFGRFRIFVPALFGATHVRASTRTTVVVQSPIVTAQVRVKVGAAVVRAGRKTVRIRGTSVPATPEGRAVLQRRNARGGWTFVGSQDVREQSATRSRYAFKVKRAKAVRRYRVRVIARDGGEHVPGTSRTVKVKPAARRR
jgi:hypothetical protein